MNNAGRIPAVAWRILGSERAWAALLLVLSAFSLVQGARYLMIGRRERAVLKLLVAQKSVPPERAKSKPAQEYDLAIMDHGMLGRMPIRLWGILGDSALFGTSSDDAQPAKAGETLSNGEKVVEVRLNEVVLEKDGKRRTETVFEELRMPPQPGPVPRPGRGADVAPKAEPRPLPGADVLKAAPAARTESK